MSVLFCGNEMDAVFANGVTPTYTTTSRETTMTRSAIQIGSGTVDANLKATQTDMWIHFRHAASSNLGNSRDRIRVFNASGDVLRIRGSGLGASVERWTGSAWSVMGTIFLADESYTRDWDIHIVGGVGVEVYLNGTLNVAFAHASLLTNFTGVRFEGSNNTNYYSQIIVADEPTIGWKLQQKHPTGNGAQTAFSGAFGDVDDTNWSTAVFSSGAANGDTETLTGGAGADYGSRSVKAVAVGINVRNDGVAPTKAQGVLRKGGTDYPSADLANLIHTAVDANFRPHVAIWHLDPSTTAPWVVADAIDAALEFGMKAVT